MSGEAVLFPPILLNVDAGEYPDEPEGLYGVAHIVNIACGGHAGDDASMSRVLSACARFGTRAGAHPSYADRAGFGRRDVTMSALDVEAMVTEQVARLASLAKAIGQVVTYVKPHGALYHAANRAPELARAVVAGSVLALKHPFTLVGPPEGQLRRAVEEAHLAYAREGFADRATKGDGTLIPRSEPGAMITDPASARAVARQLALSGTVDTVCVHSDTTASLLIGHAVRTVLDALNEP
jgi:5-oxoprolinase (ATP-hydrolysing) subunit A